MNNIRADFPLLQKKQHGYPLVYLDNAATTQKPQAVLDALMHFYTNLNANIYRGAYTLGEEATQAYEQARRNVARFIGAVHESEIVFTSGTTESINLIAAAWAEQQLSAGDEIIISELEHHANILPWQRIVKKKNGVLRYMPVLADGTLDYTIYESLLSSKTKLVSISHVSNALGTHNDLHRIIRAAHAVGARVMVDAAQSVAHQPINVHDLNCDFLAFSGHKILAPTGIGVVYVARRLHDQLSPYQVGGGMVYSVDWQNATWQKMPHLLEAGTPAIAQAIGLSAALDYIDNHIDRTAQQRHEASLCAALIDGLSQLPGVTILGPQEQLKKQGHLVSFTIDGLHPHDIAAHLDARGICVRAGHHCAQPVAKKLGIEASVRASFYAYNTHDEVETLLRALHSLIDSR